MSHREVDENNPIRHLVATAVCGGGGQDEATRVVFPPPPTSFRDPEIPAYTVERVRMR